MPFFRVSLRPEEKVLVVSSYEDNEETRRMGIGKSFYTRLYEVARHLGFSMVAGLNNARNIAIFREKFARNPLRDIDPAKRLELSKLFEDSTFSHSPQELLDHITVHFLDPKTADEYLLPRARTMRHF